MASQSSFRKYQKPLKEVDKCLCSKEMGHPYQTIAGKVEYNSVCKDHLKTSLASYYLAETSEINVVRVDDNIKRDKKWDSVLSSSKTSTIKNQMSYNYCQASGVLLHSSDNGSETVPDSAHPSDLHLNDVVKCALSKDDLEKFPDEIEDKLADERGFYALQTEECKPNNSVLVKCDLCKDDLEKCPDEIEDKPADERGFYALETEECKPNNSVLVKCDLCKDDLEKCPDEIEDKPAGKRCFCAFATQECKPNTPRDSDASSAEKRFKNNASICSITTTTSDKPTFELNHKLKSCNNHFENKICQFSNESHDYSTNQQAYSHLKQRSQTLIIPSMRPFLYTPFLQSSTQLELQKCRSYTSVTHHPLKDGRYSFVNLKIPQTKKELTSSTFNSANVQSLKSLFGRSGECQVSEATMDDCLSPQSQLSLNNRTKKKTSSNIQRIQEQLRLQIGNNEMKSNIHKAMNATELEKCHSETKGSVSFGKKDVTYSERLQKEEKPYRQWYRMSRVVTAESKFMISPMLSSHIVPRTNRNKFIARHPRESLNPEGKAGSLTPKENTESLTQKENTESLTPEGKTELLKPEGKTDSLAPEGKIKSLAPEEKIEEITPEGKIESLTPEGKIESLAPEGKIESLIPEGKIESLTHKRKIESLTPEGNTESLTPEEKTESLTSKEMSESLTPEGKIDSLTPEEKIESVAPVRTLIADLKTKTCISYEPEVYISTSSYVSDMIRTEQLGICGNREKETVHSTNDTYADELSMSLKEWKTEHNEMSQFKDFSEMSLSDSILDSLSVDSSYTESASIRNELSNTAADCAVNVKVEFKNAETSSKSRLKKWPAHSMGPSLPRYKSFTIKPLHQRRYESSNELNETGSPVDESLDTGFIPNNPVYKLRPVNSVSGVSQVTGPTFSMQKNKFSLEATPKKLLGSGPKLRTEERSRNRGKLHALISRGVNVFLDDDSEATFLKEPQVAMRNVTRNSSMNSIGASMKSISEKGCRKITQCPNRRICSNLKSRRGMGIAIEEDCLECSNRNWSSDSGMVGETMKESPVSTPKTHIHKVFLADVASKLLQKVSRTGLRSPWNESSQKYMNVKAIQDYRGSLPGQLSFQKGQKIKQRRLSSGSSDGMSYGYYRVGRLRKKRKGLFPSNCVTTEVIDPWDVSDKDSLTSSSKSVI